MSSPDKVATEEITTFQKLIQPLNETLDEIERTRSIHHLEKLTFKAFVTLMIYYFSQGIASGRLLMTDVISAPPDLKLPQVARATFFDAFKCFPVAWLAKLWHVLLKTITWVEIPELQSLGKLYCIDGSIFPALAKMPWAEYQSQTQALKLDLVFSLNQMIPVQFVVGTAKSSERTVLKQMLEAGVTYSADRGYVSFALRADIVTAQASFVLRMKANLSYSMVERLTVALPEAVCHLFEAVSDQKIHLSQAKGKPTYRLVCFHLGQDRFILMTNRFDLTTFEVILLYSYRWQIELCFRFLKRSLKGLHLLSTSPQGLTIQFYLLLISALLQLHLKQSCVQACLTAPVDPLTVSPALPDLIAEQAVTQTDGQLFLATVGSSLHLFWKISVHWLHTLRNLLSFPFDDHTLSLLGFP